MPGMNTKWLSGQWDDLKNELSKTSPIRKVCQFFLALIGSSLTGWFTGMPWYLLVWFFLLFLGAVLTAPWYYRSFVDAYWELNRKARDLILRFMDEGRDFRADQEDEINEWISRGEGILLRLLPKEVASEYLFLFGNRDYPADKRRQRCLDWLEALLVKY
jgi:hypothetical protein